MSNPNILLLIMDSVRASNTSLYGHINETTPYLEEFHENHGTLYKYCWSPSNWSLPSHASIFSGHHVESHNVTSEKDKLDSSESIFHELSEEGYNTALFTENVWVGAMDLGLKDCFEEVKYGSHFPYSDGLNPKRFVQEENAGYTEYIRKCIKHDNSMKSIINGLSSKINHDYPEYLPEMLSVDYDAYDYVEMFDNWVERTEGNWAACINFMDTHTPYEVKDRHNIWSDERISRIEKENSRFSYYRGNTRWWKLKAQESLYDGCIHQVDSAISNLIEGLKDKGEFENTYIVITGDHGEVFGKYNEVTQHRGVYHMPNLHEPGLRVPLLTKEPKQDTSSVESDLASLTNYKQAVLSAIKNEKTSDSFTSDTVLTSYSGSNSGKIENFEDLHGDRNIVTERGKAAYKKDSDGRIIKLMNWEDRYGAEVISDESVVDDYSGREVDSIFDSINSSRDELNVGSDVEEIGEETKQRLEELGYM